MLPGLKLQLLLFFVYLAQHSPAVALAVLLVIGLVAGFILSRTTGVPSQRRLLVFSLSVCGAILLLMAPYLLHGADAGNASAIYGILLAVSFYAVLLGMFVFLPVAAFLLVTASFALIFSALIARPATPPAHHATDQAPAVSRATIPRRFGRRSG